MIVNNVVEFRPNINKSFLDELATLASFCRQDMNQIAANASLLYGALREKVAKREIVLG